jgi:hypothetical protein
MIDLYCEKLKTKIRVTSREKMYFLDKVQDKEALNKFEYLMLSVEEIDGQKPTYNLIVDFFREIVWDLIGKLRDSSPCVPQLYGELLPDRIAEYYRYVCTSNEKSRFYFPEVENSSKDNGFLYSWINFEYNEKNLEEMRLDYITILEGFIVEKEGTDYFTTFYKRNWSDKNVFEELIRKSITYINFDYDFDFMDILTRLPIDEVIQRLKDGLQYYDSKHAKDKPITLG